MFHNRLEYERQRKGLTQDEISKKAGIARSTYGNYATGRREPDLKTIEKLADALDIDVSLLLIGRTIENKNADLVSIPVLGTIKAGYDLYADQHVIDYKPVSREDVMDGEYFFLIVKGDSMIEEGIRDGMRVLVRRQESVEQGKIGIIIINGDEGTLKRVFYQPDETIILQASNRDIPPRILSVFDVRIQGQVTKVEWDV